jgi:hypothetical protein
MLEVNGPHSTMGRWRGLIRTLRISPRRRPRTRRVRAHASCRGHRCSRECSPRHSLSSSSVRSIMTTCRRRFAHVAYCDRHHRELRHHGKRRSVAGTHPGVG